MNDQVEKIETPEEREDREGKLLEAVAADFGDKLYELVDTVLEGNPNKQEVFPGYMFMLATNIALHGAAHGLHLTKAAFSECQTHTGIAAAFDGWLNNDDVDAATAHRRLMHLAEHFAQLANEKYPAPNKPPPGEPDMKAAQAAEAGAKINNAIQKLLPPGKSVKAQAFGLTWAELEQLTKTGMLPEHVCQQFGLAPDAKLTELIGEDLIPPGVGPKAGKGKAALKLVHSTPDDPDGKKKLH